MASRPRLSRNIMAKLSLDKKSSDKFNAQLKALAKVASKEIITEALLAGGLIIADAANTRAPGPHILVQVVTGRTLLKSKRFKGLGVYHKRKYSGFGEVKSAVRFAAIGPDAEHWYYRFFELGATKHDISVNSPGYVAFEGGVFAFAKQSGGIPMRPFLRPAVDQSGGDAVKAMGVVLAREIKKAAKG